MSSVVRTTTGIDDERQRHRAGQPEKCPIVRDQHRVDEQADDDRRRATAGCR